ncbi:MAG TPA: class I SAM-dependent methyltransferase [Bacteroidales bacterium]|nr:class I SAM-dependent methyltransferase [Bacteroidales bacterium]
MNWFLFRQIFQFLGWQIIWPVHFALLRKAAFTNVFLHQVIINTSRKVSNGIPALRKKMLTDKRIIDTGHYGAGSKKGTSIRQICDVARYSSTGSKKGLLLLNIVELYKPHTIIELGTSLGFGSMYMADSDAESHIISIEGSRELHELAARNISQLGFTNVHLVNDTFDEALPEWLKKNDGCDLLFIDGNHMKEATLKYFQVFLPYAKPGSIVVFDDIRWSQGMYEAWSEIRKHEAVKTSIDLFSVGIVFFEPLDCKQHFRICY